MSYKKVKTTRCEQTAIQLNRINKDNKDIFFVVAPQNTTCMYHYMLKLTETFKNNTLRMFMHNDYTNPIVYYPDYNNDYAVYEITKVFEDGIFKELSAIQM